MRDIFLIYQLKNDKTTRALRFESFTRLQSAGVPVDRNNYNYVYTALLADNTPEGIFSLFNFNRPTDFKGHSLSVSDVIVLRRDGQETAHYVDSVGFVDVPEFLEGRYRYYSTQRPVDIGTFPETDNGPVRFVNFDQREWVENATCRAWGDLVYDAPLSQKQINDYELHPASDNPDHSRLSPYQLEARAQIIGAWEKSQRIPDNRRLTWWHSDFGVFVKKEFVSEELLIKCYERIVIDQFVERLDAQERVNKKSITEMLSDGTKQTVREDTARPASAKDKDKDR